MTEDKKKHDHMYLSRWEQIVLLSERAVESLEAKDFDRLEAILKDRGRLIGSLKRFSISEELKKSMKERFRTLLEQDERIESLLKENQDEIQRRISTSQKIRSALDTPKNPVIPKFFDRRI